LSKRYHHHEIIYRLEEIVYAPHCWKLCRFVNDLNRWP
jgi:hypothetical protein